MLYSATQTVVDGIWNVTPEEPTSLGLALTGLGTLAIYAAVTGWRPSRRNLVADSAPKAEDETFVPGTIIRRAA